MSLTSVAVKVQCSLADLNQLDSVAFNVVIDGDVTLCRLYAAVTGKISKHEYTHPFFTQSRQPSASTTV